MYKYFCAFLFILNAPAALTKNIEVANIADKCEFNIEIASTTLRPLVYEEQGKVVGAVTNTVKTFLNEQNLQAEITLYSWARALATVKNGASEAIYPALESKDRTRYLDYSLPAIGEVTIALYTLENNNYSSEKEIIFNENTPVATLRELEINQLEFHGAPIFEVTKFEHAVEMLRRNRVTYIIGVKEILISYFEYNAISDIEEVLEISKRPIYLALAKNSSQYLHIKSCLKK